MRKLIMILPLISGCFNGGVFSMESTEVSDPSYAFQCGLKMDRKTKNIMLSFPLLRPKNMAEEFYYLTNPLCGILVHNVTVDGKELSAENLRLLQRPTSTYVANNTSDQFIYQLELSPRNRQENDDDAVDYVFYCRGDDLASKQFIIPIQRSKLEVVYSGLFIKPDGVLYPDKAKHKLVASYFLPKASIKQTSGGGRVMILRPGIDAGLYFLFGDGLKMKPMVKKND